jgi:catechol 2,3-dioxygenase-like lactoylglutathione lyase family enzyme
VLLDILEFCKNRSVIAGEPHVHYYNRQLGFSLRPARLGTAGHDAYAPGLHHLCWRVETVADVDVVAQALERYEIAASAPRLYAAYAPDYYAIFFEDPDGVRLEVTNFREQRRQRMFDWETAR